MIVDRMKVSICVPVYGVEKFIERCVVSLFEQSYKDIEYIFVDDCSKDKSVEVINEVAKKYPQRIDSIKIIHHKKNRGLAAARNTAVFEATGDIIMHVDSDDYIAIDAVSDIVSMFLQTNADIVYFDYVSVENNEKVYHRQPDIINPKDKTISLLSKNYSVGVVLASYKRSLYVNYGIKESEGVNFSEDFHTSPRLSYYASRIAILHKPLYYYICMNAESYTATFSESHASQLMKSIDILKDFFSDKEQEYIIQLYESELYSITQLLNQIVRSDGGKKLFEKYKNRARLIDKEYWAKLPVPRKVVLYLPYGLTLKAYIKIVTSLKNKKIFFNS